MTYSLRSRAGIGLSVLGALVLTACSSPSPSDDARVTDNTAVTEDAPPPGTSDAELVREVAAGTDPAVAEVPDLTLPTQSEDNTLVAPGWEVTPQYLDGVFMAPVDVGGHLEFTAMDAMGNALWKLERPLACTGFTLTTGPDGPVAVINDAAPTETAIAATTASAYDLHTGELVWGPVDVPGPHQGPGLVYAAPSLEAMGASGPRVALSPFTGEVVADEADSEWSVVAENHGTVLLADDESLHALDTDGTALWDSELPTGITFAQAAASTSSGAGIQALRTDDGELTVIHLASGAVLAESVTSAALDESTGTLVTTGGIGTQGVSVATGDIQWGVPSSAEAYVVTAGGAMAYVRDGDAIRVQNTITGDVTPGYPDVIAGTIAVPSVMTGTGAAAFPHDGQVLLATEPPQ